jgi:hypothetical protein
LHELIRDASMAAWSALQAGQANPIVERLTDAAIGSGRVQGDYAAVRAEVAALLDPSTHTGNAVERCRAFAAELRQEVGSTGRDDVAAGPAY